MKAANKHCFRARFSLFVILFAILENASNPLETCEDLYYLNYHSLIYILQRSNNDYLFFFCGLIVLHPIAKHTGSVVAFCFCTIISRHFCTSLRLRKVSPTLMAETNT